MNSVGEWKTTATVRDSDRRAWWEKWLGTNTVPIKSIVPVWVVVPFYGRVLAYMLDLEALSAMQLEKLIEGIAQTFEIPISEVQAEIGGGMPIPIPGVYVTSTDPGIIFTAMDDGPQE